VIRAFFCGRQASGEAAFRKDQRAALEAFGPINLDGRLLYSAGHSLPQPVMSSRIPAAPAAIAAPKARD